MVGSPPSSWGSNLKRILVGLACLMIVASAGATPARSAAASCTIDRVIDGDTFVCTSGTHIRMLQINAQEMGDCGGEWAKAALANIFLRPGTNVRLDFDRVTQDRYGRDLAAPIVTGSDGADYNISIVMVYVGLAKAAYYGDNSKYLDWANASQTWAQKAQWNMWAPGGPYNGGTNCGKRAGSARACTSSGERQLRPGVPGFLYPAASARSGLRRHPAEELHRAAAYPHRFDGDHDRIGCES